MELAAPEQSNQVVTREDIGKILRSMGLEDVKVSKLKSPKYYVVVDDSGNILAKDPGCKGLLKKIMNKFS